MLLNDINKTASSSSPEPPPRDYLGLKSRPDFNLRHSMVAPTVSPFSRHRGRVSSPPRKHDTESSWRRCATLRRKPFVNLVMRRGQSIHDPFPPAQILCLLLVSSNSRYTTKYNNRLYSLHRRAPICNILFVFHAVIVYNLLLTTCSRIGIPESQRQNSAND